MLKRIFLSLFFPLFLGWFFFLLYPAVAQGDEPQKPSAASAFAHQLIYYSASGHVFYKKPDSGAVEKPENNIQPVSYVKPYGPEIYLTDAKNNLFKINRSKNSLKESKVFMKKPVSYDTGLKRTLVDIAPGADLYLYAQDILIGSGLKKLVTNFSTSQRFSALAAGGKYIYVGTAVNGLYYAKRPTNIHKSGYIHFKSLNAGLSFIPYNKSIKFYEEIRRIHIASNGDLLVATGVYGGLYRKAANESTFHRLPWPAKWKTSDINLITDSKSGEIWVSCTQGMLSYTKKTDQKGSHYSLVATSWDQFPEAKENYESYLFEKKTDSDLKGLYINYHRSPGSAKERRMEVAASKKLFYVSPYELRKKGKTVANLLKSDNFNGVVIDVKDDRGHILYPSEVAFAKEIGAVRPVYNLKSFIEQAHSFKKYVAVRIVVFKDPVLFQKEEFAIWDSKLNKPWIGNPGERWIDPFNPDLAERYYVPFIKELVSLGVDEIQLDYIRFPAEGLLNRCRFRYQKNGEYFSEALEEFLLKIRKATALPLSLDIYGYQGLYRTGGAIGQDMETMGNIADVISPMLYSSHFGNLYMTDVKKDKRVFRLIRHSVRRARFIADGNFLIRPYLQAFPMKSSIWGYGDHYFLDQIKADKKEEGSGYSFWGSVDHMEAVDRAINRLKTSKIKQQ